MLAVYHLSNPNIISDCFLCVCARVCLLLGKQYVVNPVRASACERVRQRNNVHSALVIFWWWRRPLWRETDDRKCTFFISDFRDMVLMLKCLITDTFSWWSRGSFFFVEELTALLSGQETPRCRLTEDADKVWEHNVLCLQTRTTNRANYRGAVEMTRSLRGGCFRVATYKCSKSNLENLSHCCCKRPDELFLKVTYIYIFFNVSSLTIPTYLIMYTYIYKYDTVPENCTIRLVS